MTRELPSPELLRKILRYEPETGKLFWRERPVAMFKDAHDASVWNTRYARAEAFVSVDRNGYRQGRALGVRHSAHRVIWAIVHGVWPDGQIDHEDGVRDNNRVNNLRDVTETDNRRNQCLPSTNTSGVIGVSWHKPNRKWLAQIRFDGKKRHIGIFSDFADAVAARRAAEVKHGYHKNHGRSRHD